MSELTLKQCTAIDLERKQKSVSISSQQTSPLLEQLTRISRHLQQITASWEPSGSTLQPRKRHRMIFSEKMMLTPICESSHQPTGEPLLIHGYDLSLGGLSFSHSQPLICHTAAITFFQPDHSKVTIATKLNWCRFSRQGIYFSGGQFLRLLDLEQAAIDDFSEFATA